jgi:hypothetical protein
MGIHNRVVAGPDESSIFTIENGSGIADDMAKKVRLDNGILYNGVYFTAADKKPGSRATGWEQMRKMLKNALKPEIGVRENEGLFIFDRCDNFIRTVPVLPRDAKKPDDVDTNTEDHIADETRYRVRQSGIKIGTGRAIGGV